MPSLKIYKLVKKNVFAELTGHNGIYNVDLEILRNSEADIDEPECLGGIFKNLESTGANSMRVVLTVESKAETLDSRFSDTIIGTIKRWGKRLFRKARVRYISNDGRRKYVDLLEGNVDAKVSAKTEENNARYLNSRSMFEALLRLYNNERSRLTALCCVLIFEREQEVGDNAGMPEKMES